MASKVRIGVVGVGHLGKHHARLLAENPMADLVGVADIDEKKLQEVSNAHGVTGYRDYKELLGKVDAVCVVVPTQGHLDVAGCFLESGVDVLVEKPIAPTAAIGQKLVDLAKQAGRILLKDGLANHPDCSLLYVFQTMVGVDKLGGVEPWHGHYPLRVDGHGINGKVTPLEVFFNAVTNGGEVYLPLGGACLFIAQNHPPHTVHLVQGNKFTV